MIAIIQHIILLFPYAKQFQYTELSIYMLTFHKDSVNPPFRQKNPRNPVFLHNLNRNLYLTIADKPFQLFTNTKDTSPFRNIHYFEQEKGTPKEVPCDSFYSSVGMPL